MIRFILDEAASLGKMEALLNAVCQLRSFGVRMCFYYQAAGQLNSCWEAGGSQTLLSNCSQIWFSCNDQQSAEMVSARLGNFTNVVASGGSSNSRSNTGSDGKSSITYGTTGSDGWQLAARQLLRPEEICQMDRRIAITFMPGFLPIMTRLSRYYERERSDGKFRVMLLSSMLFAATMLMFLALFGAFR